ncbi:Xaa-Pro peptidase family protein [Gordonia sp. (in: high G+C Gram-positive bacteria)]|uniref:M24 family metallopeptidase n=1 Tax=Gordonia sp. (in: high G+C Gram-positive bacteria) TaxID=84139 RepID=UPI002627627F|nr:Xaa-Pro peptidase family protein [Gordonia sp. (in: high G+C Gram-positive bacteria)]
MSAPAPAYAARRAAVAAGLTRRGADALVVSDLVNVRYLTGFTGSNGAVLIRADGGGTGDRIATDGRYTAQVAAQTPDVTAVIARDTLAALVAEAAGARVGIEADAVTVAQFQTLREEPGGDGATLVPLRGVVEELREVKDDGEVALVTRACAVADAALTALIERGAIAPGRTERQVARDLEWEMYERGASGIAFETIVAAGAHSAVPHHRPTDAVLATSDLVKIDFGAMVDGYHSDTTRTLVLGEPAPWQREIHEIVRVAQEAGTRALTPGADLRAVDATARQVIADAGYGEFYVHGLGHGVGLRIHEAPGIGATATGTLLRGAIVTVEPGIYLPGRGGVRIEDTLVVTESGSRSLTHTPRELRVL